MRFSPILLLLTGLFFFIDLTAQDGILGVPGTARLINQVNLSQVEDDMLTMMRSEPLAPNQEYGSDAYVAEKKRINEAFLELVKNETPTASPRSVAVTPTQGVNFKANTFNNSFPNDNDIAVSSRYIVSTTNRLVRIYDHNGRQLLNRTLAQLGGAADTIGGPFDPRALYDQNRDRWIILYINGSGVNPGTLEGYNDLMVAFSQSGDPTQSWNVYAFDGNPPATPNTSDYWMDYPQAAFTTEELFVTGNMRQIFSTGDPNEPLRSRAAGIGIWQINLDDGFFGSPTIAFETYYDNSISLGVRPMEGLPDVYGPEMYFLAKSQAGGSARFIDVLKISGTMNDPSTTYSREARVNGVDAYSTPPDARQPNSNNDPTRLLDTNGGRSIHGFRTKNNLYGIFSSSVLGRPGFYLAKVKLSPLGPAFHGLESTLIHSNDLDLGFPSITFAGQSCDLQNGGSVEDLFIGFNFASPSKFPGNGVYYVNIKGEVSEPKILVEGLNNLRLTGPNDSPPRNRWGDYSDVATRGNFWEAFVGGYFAESNGDHTTWISQIEVNPPQENWCLSVNIDERDEIVTEELKAYPNPVMDFMTFEFTVEKTDLYRAYITDMHGRYIRSISTDYLLPGVAKIGFDAAALPAGQYQVIVDARDSNRLLTKKITVVK